MMIKLTFDNSVRINAFKNPADYSGSSVMHSRVAAAIKLRKYYERNPELIEITCNGGERLKQPEGTENFKKTRGIGILDLRGFSELDESFILTSNEFAPILERIREIIQPASDSESSMKDYAVLCEHAVAGRDIFVSEDKPKHLKKALRLKSLGIIVKSAAETVAYLEEQYEIDFTMFVENC